MLLDTIQEADLTTLKAAGYTEDDLRHLADTEVQALLEGSRDEAAGAADAADDAAADAAAAGGAADDKADEAAAAAADAGKASEQAPSDNARPFVPQYTAQVPDGSVDKIKGLKDEERAAFKRLMDGEIDADEYQTIRDRTEAEADDLKATVMKARIFKDVNEQNQAQQAEREWKTAQDSSMAQFKGEGIDYMGKPALLAAYNTHLKALAADQKNENRDAQWFLTEAHKLTKADLGIGAATAGGGNSGAGARNAPTKVVDDAEIPPSLRGVPASATSAVNTDEFAHLRALMDGDPIEFERAVARLTDAQRDRWMAA